MKVEIAFGSRRARVARLPHRFHQMKPGETLIGTILTSWPIVVVYHWLPEGHPIVHTMPVCLCQSRSLPARERGYVGFELCSRVGNGPVQKRFEVLEMPDSLRGGIEGLLGDRKSTRGLKLELHRPKSRPNAPIQIVRSRWVDDPDLAADLDVRGVVEQMWERWIFAPVEDAPPLARGPGCVDPDEEIPFFGEDEGGTVPFTPRGKGGVA